MTMLVRTLGKTEGESKGTGTSDDANNIKKGRVAATLGGSLGEEIGIVLASFIIARD